MIELNYPPTNTPHLMADYLELCVIFSKYDDLAISDLLSLLNEDEGKEWIDEEAADIAQKTSSEFNELTLTKANDWLEHLKSRKQIFGNFYPFDLKKKVFKVAKKLTKKHHLYMFLLFCSRLRTFNKPNRAKLARLFEIISAKALERMIPNGTVKIFGQGSEDRKTHFGNKLKDAIRKLIEDINAISVDILIDQISNRDNGDKGLDIVGYLPWDDPARGTMAFFGQCAAMEDNWEMKKAEVTRFYSYVKFSHVPVNLLFIPGCFRNPLGTWVEDAPTDQCIFFDRLRICNLLKGKIPSTELQDPSLTKLFTYYGLN